MKRKTVTLMKNAYNSEGRFSNEKILVKYIWKLLLYYIMYFPIYMLPMT